MSSPLSGSAHPRIAVMPLFYGRPDVVQGCLRPLIAGAPGRYDILAIENPSEHSPENRAALTAAMSRGEVAGAYFPDRNAVFNSLLIALARDLFGVEGRYDYVILSDGDVAVGPEPFVEQQALMDAHPSMSSCSLRIDIRQWSQRSKPFLSTVNYAAAAISAEASGQPYAVTAGGFWMRMFRTAEILKLARIFDHNGVRLRDTTIDQFFRTCGMFPACTIKSLGVELPHGPLFDPADRTKQKASRELQGLGQRDVFYNDLSPGGAVHWPGFVEVSSPETFTLSRPAPADPAALEPHHVAGLIDGERRAILLPERPLWSPPAPVVLLFERPMERVLAAEDGRSLSLPLTTLAQGSAYEPFLDEIAFDARAPERWSRGVLQTLTKAAARALRPGGALTITTSDWYGAAEDYSRKFQLLEAAVTYAAPGLDSAAKLVSRSANALDIMLSFEPGRVIHAGLRAGLQMAGMQRNLIDERPATVIRLRRPG